MKSLAEALWYTQMMLLSKKVLQIVAARQRNAQTIEALRAYTLLGQRGFCARVVLFLENMLPLQW